MALGRVKTWIVEILTASDLNAEFNNILNNPISLISPLTGTLDANGNEIVLDADGDSSITADTDDQIDLKVGGTDRVQLIDSTKKLALTGVALDEAKGADIASATTPDIGAGTGTQIDITGTTTITGFATVQAGTRREIEFDGILTLTHNGTSLILPGAANITTAAGDTGTFISLGSGNWRCHNYQRAATLGGSRVLIGTATASTSASVAFTWAGKTYRKVEIILSNVQPATDNVDLYIRTSTDGGVGYDAGATDYAYAVTFASVSRSSAGDTQILCNRAATSAIGNAAGEGWGGIVTVLDPAAADFTQIVFRGGAKIPAGTVNSLLGYGQRLSAADVDGIQFSMSSGNIASGEFVAWGIL